MNTITLAKDQTVLGFLKEHSMKSKVQNQESDSQRKFSNQLQSVLLIFNADPYLMTAVSPYINIETESINWPAIQKLPLGAGHRSAVAWAYGLWRDEPLAKTNCFDGALNMTSFMKVAVLEALCLRWGLRE